MPRKSMRSRRSRSRRGGSWDDPSTWSLSNPFASKTPDNTGSTGSTGYGSTDYGSTGSTDYGSTDSTGSNDYGSTETTDYTQQPNSGMGGKKGKRRRSMRGGDYSDNISLNNLAANAAPFSNGNTATAPYVGGRTRRHRHTKSCKKSCRKYHRHNKSCKKSCRKH